MNKVWFNGKFIDINKAKINLLTHTLHYGSGVFEGIRCYGTQNGPAIFRLDDHLKRLYNSAKLISIPIPHPLLQLKKAILNLVKINRLENCYIRPIVFLGGENIGLNIKNRPINTAIIVLPFTLFKKKSLKIKISKFIRLHPKSIIPQAKTCGYYINSILANTEAHQNGFDEALLLDYKGYIAEGSGENIFFVKKGFLYTPKLGNILPGITRDTVFKIAKDFKIKIIEKNISPNEIKNMEEAFFSGTAAEITAIGQINDIIINNKEEGKITKLIRETYHKIVKGEIKKYNFWLSYVK